MVLMKGEAMTAGSKPIFSARIGREEPTSLAQATTPTSVAHTTAATMGVTAVGKNMVRSPKFFLLATRVLAELGAHIIKTYYCEGFEKIVAACPVPIVIAGGKVLPPDQALTMAYHAICDGANGVDMGRNIFQADDPKAMAKAVRMIVHEGATDKEAYEFYLDTKKK